MRIYLKNYGQTINGIYHILHHSAKDRKILFKMNLEDFSIWYNQQKRKCVYCNRLESEIIKDHNKKYRRLTIDRKDNNKGYIINNLVLCCYKCNTVKGSDLTFNDMIKIGKILNTIYTKNEE